MSPVGRLVFKTSEVHSMRLVGSTPTSSAIFDDGRIAMLSLSRFFPGYQCSTKR